MNKMRDGTKYILWLLVFAFGVIWVLQDSGGLDVIGTLGTNVGSVNGDPITLEEYSLAVENQVQNYQSQTGNSMPVQMLDQTRDRIFDQLVDDKLRLQEMDRIGLNVADEEIIELINGETPHPIITMNFGDAEGNVDRALLDNFIENPDARVQWLQIEEFLRGERRRTKLDGLIMASVRVGVQDVDFAYDQQNRKVDVSYIASRFTSVSDDSISYNDSDLRRFYNDHRSEFEREKSFTLDYVSVSKLPTAEDSSSIFSDVEGLRTTFETTTEDSLFLTRNGSERPYVDVYFSPDELDEPLSDAIFANATSGAVIGPIVSENQAHLVKIIDIRTPETPKVEARHVLVKVETDAEQSVWDEALTEANEVLSKLRGGEDFAIVARLHSDDPGSASRGGSLGWFGPGQMVPEFEDAALGARIGRFVGPVKSAFGYHIIEVTNRATVEAKIADFALTIRASIATLNRVQGQLDDLQYFSEESGDFSGEAGRRGFEVKSVQVEAEQTFIPGIGNSRALTNFLATASSGNLSPVIELNDQFIAAIVSDVQSKGTRSFEDVRATLEPRLRNELKSELLANKMRAALSSGWDGIASDMGTTERSTTDLSFSNMVIDGIGRDPKFVGTAMGLNAGDISDVVIGINSVYVIRVDSVKEPEPATAEQREQVFAQLLARRQNLIRNQWISALRDEADIVDSRRLFQQ